MLVEFVLKLLFGQQKRLATLQDQARLFEETPDGLIAAHIVNSIAKNYDDWTLTKETDKQIAAAKKRAEDRGKPSDWSHYHWLSSRSVSDMCLSNAAKNIVVTYKYDSYGDTRPDFAVNGVGISGDYGKKIVEAYQTIKKERARLKEIADEALRKQKLNEEKWNLFEKLAGFRRNEYGALVPVKPEGDNENNRSPEQTPDTVRRKTSRANRTPERAVRQSSGACSPRLSG